MANHADMRTTRIDDKRDRVRTALHVFNHLSRHRWVLKQGLECERINVHGRAQGDLIVQTQSAFPQCGYQTLLVGVRPLIASERIDFG